MSPASRPRLHPHGTARMLLADPGAPVSGPFEALRRGAELHDLDDHELHCAEELVQLSWSLAADERQILVLLVLASILAARQGSSRLPLDGPRGFLGRTLAALARAADLPADAARLCRQVDRLLHEHRLDRLIGAPGEFRPLIVSGAFLYQQRMLALEQSLVTHTRRLLEEGFAGPTGAAVDEALAALRVAPARPGGPPAAPGTHLLSDEQLAAVRAALAQRLTVITGGPGTGKTSVVVSILRCALRLGLAPEDLALAAPTGKAAQRMAGAIRTALGAIAPLAAADAALLTALPEPRTLHRLLGYLPREQRFRHHENHPIPARLIVVDEASMVDLSLMERLLGALAPGSQLVLLGDADQLPSVEAGAVLRDLVRAADRRPTGLARRLTRSYRMDPADPDGRAILLCAAAVIAGQAQPEDGSAGPAMRRRAAELRFRGVEFLSSGDGDELGELLERWYRSHLEGDERTRRLVQREYQWNGRGFDPDDCADLRALLHHHGRARLLTVTRRGAHGVEEVNRRLHDRWLRALASEWNPAFAPGGPVIMRHNAYQRGLFNGDQGLVVRVRGASGDDRQRYRVVFPRGDGFAVHSIEALRAHLELAYATTVHQSQGSEFDCVALVLPDRDLPLLSRELLYTAMTRARRSVVLVGSRALFRAGVRRAIERFSGLADAL